MKRRAHRSGTNSCTPFLACMLACAGAPQAHGGVTDWEDGYVFLALVYEGRYQVYDQGGVLLETVVALPGCSSATHAAFRGAGDLWMSLTGDDVKSETIVDCVRSIDDAHPHPAAQIVDLYNNMNMWWPNGFVLDRQGGYFFTAITPVAGGVRRVVGIGGVYSGVFPVQILSSDSPNALALAPDQRTLFYSTLDRIKRYDLATQTQLPDYLDASDNVEDFALLPPYDGSSGVIAALNQSVQRFDASGALVQVYDLPDFRFWGNVSLHPDGTTFWSSGKPFAYGQNSRLVRFDIAEAYVVQGPIDVGTYLTQDLLVRGELLGGNTAPKFDEPTPCATTARAYVGVPFTFDVSGSDINLGDTVTLAATSLPGGVVMTPALPAVGNPVASTLSWTPGASDTGEHTITFELTDYLGNERTCTLTVTVEPGAPYCFGDGLDPVVTAVCPCTNFGDLGHGCANSNASLGGALLAASGTTSPNTVLFRCESVPNNTLCTFFQTVTSVPAGFVFGDGVRCVNTPLIRFGQQNSGQNGTPANTAEAAPIVTPYGFTRHYQCQYRNPAPAFCPPATFNMSNAYTIAW